MLTPPSHIAVTTYGGVPGAHLVGHDSDALQHLCPASRDERHEIRHYWTIYALDDPQAPPLDCPDCAALLTNLKRLGRGGAAGAAS